MELGWGWLCPKFACCHPSGDEKILAYFSCAYKMETRALGERINMPF